jgi:ParB-like chromosome segregation protein Spo0J
MGLLKRSIREFGFVSPVVVRQEDNVILGGHQRIEALRAVAVEDGVDPGTIQVPVAYVSGLTDEQAKLLNISLNKISGDWDYDKLSDLLDSMSGLGLEKLQVTGFSDREIADIVALSGDVGDLAQPLIDNVDEVIAAEKRKLVVELASDEDRAFVVDTLRQYGAQSENHLGDALVAALKALPPKVS